jgi:hypothetical protein
MQGDGHAVARARPGNHVARMRVGVGGASAPDDTRIYFLGVYAAVRPPYSRPGGSQRGSVAARHVMKPEAHGVADGQLR